jgi:hypothetical protein
VPSRLRTVLGAVLAVVAALAAGRALGLLPGVSQDDPGPGTMTIGRPSPAATDGPDQLAAVLDQGGTPLVRSDRSDDEAWRRVVDAVTQPLDVGAGEDDDEPFVVPVDTPGLEGLTPSELAASTSAEFASGYAVVADDRSMAEARSGGEVTVAYVALSRRHPGRSFRCAAERVAEVEANLSIANLDFRDFATAVDPDGVYRGGT